MPAKHRSDHLIVHFKDRISPVLARAVPFTCPKCRFVAMDRYDYNDDDDDNNDDDDDDDDDDNDRATLIRHFATRHGLVEAFLKVSSKTIRDF